MTTAVQKNEVTTPPETLLYLEVRRQYLQYFSGNPEFNFELDMDAFRRLYAEAAHLLKIYHHRGKSELSAEELEDRRRYNLYFGLVRKKLSDYLKRKQREKAAPEETRCAAQSCICEPAQPDLFRGTQRPLQSLAAPQEPVSFEPQRPVLPAHDRIQLNLFGEPNPRLLFLEYASQVKAEVKRKQFRPGIHKAAH